jgi:hypothetical protein
MGFHVRKSVAERRRICGSSEIGTMRASRNWSLALQTKEIALSREKPNDDPREQTDSSNFRQGDKPWEQPKEKEQRGKVVRKSDLEKWQESDTH